MVEMIECLECKTRNHSWEVNCRNCRLSLRAARAAHYLDQAASAVQSGQYDAARVALNAADLEMLALSSDERGKYLLTPRAFTLQAQMYFGKGMLDEAKGELLLAEQHLLGVPEGAALLAEVLNRLGGLYYYENQFEQAVDYYQRSGAAAIGAGIHAAASTALANLSLIYVERHQISAATALLTRALAEAELSANNRAIANTCRLLAWLYSDHGPYSLALKYAAQAVALAPLVSDVEMRCLVNVDAARVYLRAGELERGRKYMHAAYDTARGSGNKIAREAVENYLAEFVREDGKLPTWFNEQDFSDSAGLSSPLLLSNYALRLGYYSVGEEATPIQRYLRWIREQLKDTARLDNEDLASLEHAQALLYSRLGDEAEAAAHFEVALNMITKPYEQAMLQEEYGAMLLGKADDPQAQAKSGVLLAAAAALYEALELPYRAQRVAALRPSLADPSQLPLPAPRTRCASP